MMQMRHGQAIRFATFVLAVLLVAVSPRAVLPYLGEGWERGADGSTSLLTPTAADAAALALEINYAHELVQGLYEPGHVANIVVTESDATTVKGVAHLTTEVIPDWGGASGFSTGLQDWSGPAPDIQPGDWIFVSIDADYADAAVRNAVRVGAIAFQVDYTGDAVSGSLTAGWLTAAVLVRCTVPEYPGSPAVDSMVDPNGGAIDCDFGSEGWDLQPPQAVDVSYWEPDGDHIANSFDWPLMVAHVGPDSGGNRRLTGEHAGPNVEVTVTVTDDVGGLVGTAVVGADAAGGFDTGEALPDGSLAFWHQVGTDFGNGITDSLTLYPISAQAFPATDVVEILAAGDPWFTLELEYCSPLLECGRIGLGELGLSGIVSVDLMAEHGFDVVPGARFKALLRVENGQLIEYSWSLPAPELSIEKWFAGGAARPGGTLTYLVHYRNEGTTEAENVSLTDTLPPGTGYLGDTSGVPSNTGSPGIVSWDLGTVFPGETGTFAVTLSVAPTVLPGAGAIGENCVLVSTTSLGDWNPGNDLSCAGPVDVVDDTIDFSVIKWAMPGDPAAGQQFDYVIRWCNKRETGAGPLILTDTLPPGMNLLDWRPDDAGKAFWNLQFMTGGQLQLSAPGLPGGSCGEVYLRVELDPGIEAGTELVNQVQLSIAGDSNVSDNAHLHVLSVGVFRQDLAIAKGFASGVLVPGGWAEFDIRYWNAGNLATPTAVTEFMPPGLTYLGAWWSASGTPLPAPSQAGNELHWNLPELPVGGEGVFRIRFGIATEVLPESEWSNCVAVEGSGPESSPDDNFACSPYRVSSFGSNLNVEKRHEWLDDLHLGYRIRFSNTGDGPVFDVVLRDTLPPGVVFDGWWTIDPTWGARLNGDPVYSGGVLTWVFGWIDPGETGELQFRAALESPPLPLQRFVNLADITISSGDPHPEDNITEDLAFSGNQCVGNDVVLTDQGYADTFLCGAAGSINALAVTVTGTGHLILNAPVVALGGGFTVMAGGRFSVLAW